MAQKPKKPPYSWFRWQMRPRIYDDEQFAAKRGIKNASVEDEEKNNSAKISQGESSEENSVFNKENGENKEGLEENLNENGKEKGKKEGEEEQIELEKGDLFAMILSAMLTIFPICVGLLLLIVLSAYFLFIH